MRKANLILIALLAVTLSGCVIAPYRHHRGGPNAAVYVAPTYAIPGPGYVWAQNLRHGWGWRHPRLGWHRGWR